MAPETDSAQTPQDSAITPDVVHHAYDVLVIGAGGAGLRAAIEARMHGKRALTREQQGRGYVYALPDSPDTAQASMTAFQMQRLLDNLDNGADRAGVLAQFVANLEADDERMLQQLLRDTKRHGRSGRDAHGER